MKPNLPKKKLVNFRLIFTSALAMLIACAFAINIFKSAKAKLIVAIIFAVLFVIFVILRLILKIKIFTLFSCIALVIMLPHLVLHFKTVKLDEYTKYSGDNTIIYGKIVETKLYDEDSFRVVLDDVSIILDNGEEKIDGKITFNVPPKYLDLTKFEIGTFISVKGKFEFFTLSNDRGVQYKSYLTRGIVARGYTYFYQISITDCCEPTLKDNIRKGVKDKFDANAGEYSDLGYAMMFGDSTFLDEDVKDIFRDTGIAHLLAVSGLHISVLVLAISFILKLIRSPKIVNIFVVAAILSFYCYVCGFSVSVIRASLMAVFSLYALSRGKSYDRLTGLSLVAVIILAIEPLQLFNISFVLSFSAVLAIILVAVPLTRVLNKFLHHKLAEMLSLIIAVQIGLLVTNLFYFGKFALTSILTNFVSVPIASIAYTYLIFACILSFVMPFISPVLILFSYVMSVVVKFNFWATGLGLIINFAEMKAVAIVGILIVMFIVSDYLFVKKNTKVLLSVITLLVCAFVGVIMLV